VLVHVDQRLEYLLLVAVKRGLLGDVLQQPLEEKVLRVPDVLDEKVQALAPTALHGLALEQSTYGVLLNL